MFGSPGGFNGGGSGLVEGDLGFAVRSPRAKVSLFRLADRSAGTTHLSRRILVWIAGIGGRPSDAVSHKASVRNPRRGLSVLRWRNGDCRSGGRQAWWSAALLLSKRSRSCASNHSDQHPKACLL